MLEWGGTLNILLYASFWSLISPPGVAVCFWGKHTDHPYIAYMVWEARKLQKVLFELLKGYAILSYGDKGSHRTGVVKFQSSGDLDISAVFFRPHISFHHFNWDADHQGNSFVWSHKSEWNVCNVTFSVVLVQMNVLKSCAFWLLSAFAVEMHIAQLNVK